MVAEKGQPAAAWAEEKAASAIEEADAAFRGPLWPSERREAALRIPRRLFTWPKRPSKICFGQGAVIEILYYNVHWL